MQKQILKLIFLVVVFFAVPNFASAADVYMSKTGTKTTGKSTAGNWSNSNCYNNLEDIFIANSLSPGDTLTIDDGIYTGASNSIHQWNFPPSGTAGNFIVIRAKNIPCQNGVACNQPLKVHFDGANGAVFEASNYPENDPAKKVEYIKFWGIRWDGISTYTNWDHLYFKQVASMGISDGNSAVFDMSGQHNLVEDCIAFGKGRYKFLFYDISRELQLQGPGNNVCRRCIVRHDWAKKEDPTQDPVASFSSYYNRGTALLNPIDIDSSMPAYWMRNPGELSGAFYQPVDDSSNGQHLLDIEGGIVINSAMNMGQSSSSSVGSGNIYQDIVGINVAGGFLPRGGGTFNRISLLNVNSGNYTYRNALQKSNVLAIDDGIFNWSDSPFVVTNSIFKNLAGIGIYGNATSNYMNMHGVAGGNYSGVSPAVNLISSNPIYNAATNPLGSLKYPVRIENSSALSAAGSFGGQIGARITNKLGVDGAFKGDANWNTEQGSLWPWPLEDWVQAEMRTSDYSSFCAPFAATANACPSTFATDAYRGFASSGVDAWGQPITLTKYIWQSLGNQIPCEIYGTCGGDVIAPSAPSGLSVL